uniref:PlsC domain-containing protein n=1 Tax=Elaeophora elaphi TaxID=1147741 RepID=A0A158Q7P2_9BILA
MRLPNLTGFFFWLLLFLSSFLGSIFLLFPFIPLVYFSPSLWRIFADCFIGYWLILPSSLCDYILGIKFHITGDMINYSEPALIIMNHRTRLDWMFFWNVLYKMDPWLLTTEKISLKKTLEYIPGAGWAMQCAAYLFLERNYKSDARTISDMITYYKDLSRHYQILLFPEGTDRGERAVKRSDEFAIQHGLPIYHFVLHPRTTGFAYMIQVMREKNYLKNVYDITIGYPDEIVSSEMEILQNGRFPHAVHFDVKRYKESDLPNDNSGLADWINKIWREKENRLENFYKADVAHRKFLSCNGKDDWPVRTTSTSIGYYCAFLFWITISVIWIYSVICFFFVKIYVCFACVFYVYCHWQYAGVQNLALQLFKQQQINQNSE